VGERGVAWPKQCIHVSKHKNDKIKTRKLKKKKRKKERNKGVGDIVVLAFRPNPNSVCKFVIFGRKTK
jgi:hypothetical protein